MSVPFPIHTHCPRTASLAHSTSDAPSPATSPPILRVSASCPHPQTAPSTLPSSSHCLSSNSSSIGLL